MADSSIYGDIASYFSQSGATKSQGKAGGASGSQRQYQSSGGDSTNITPTAGNAGWVSASLGLSSSDKSAFTTPFSQQFGGITNNQVINSPGATGATTTSPIAPITGAPPDTAAALGGASPISLMLAIFAGVALILYVRK